MCCICDQCNTVSRYYYYEIFIFEEVLNIATIHSSVPSTNELPIYTKVSFVCSLKRTVLRRLFTTAFTETYPVLYYVVRQELLLCTFPLFLLKSYNENRWSYGPETFVGTRQGRIQKGRSSLPPELSIQNTRI